jgi:serine/threonine-protein kinase
MSDFHQQNRDEWIALQLREFGNSPPATQEWSSVTAIVRALTPFCGQPKCHMMLPGSGGNELTGVAPSSEPGCLELLGGIPNIVRPARLLFETIPDDRSLSYFRLETSPLTPSRAYDDSSGFFDDVVEVSPQHYVKREGWDAGYYLDDSGQRILLPRSARRCARWFTGAFVVFAKGSIYNSISETYDGRHAKMTTSVFRAYVEGMALVVKQLTIPE